MILLVMLCLNLILWETNWEYGETRNEMTSRENLLKRILQHRHIQCTLVSFCVVDMTRLAISFPFWISCMTTCWQMFYVKHSGNGFTVNQGGSSLHIAHRREKRRGNVSCCFVLSISTESCSLLKVSILKKKICLFFVYLSV